MVAYAWVLGVSVVMSIVIGILLTYQMTVLKNCEKSTQYLIHMILTGVSIVVVLYLVQTFHRGEEEIRFFVVLLCTFAIMHQIVKLFFILTLQFFRYKVHGCEWGIFFKKVTGIVAILAVCFIAIVEMFMKE